MNVDNNLIDNSAPAVSEKCRSCKMFYGSNDTAGLCSKCYTYTSILFREVNPKKDKVEQVKQKSQEKVEVAKETEEEKKGKGPQDNKNRCFLCRKKIGLLGCKCKCGYLYCNSHRLPQEHECCFDYQGQGRKQLEKEIIKAAPRKMTDEI